MRVDSYTYIGKGACTPHWHFTEILTLSKSCNATFASVLKMEKLNLRFKTESAGSFTTGGKTGNRWLSIM